MKYQSFGLVLLTAGTILTGFVLFTNSKYSENNRPFSAYGMLYSSWEKYREAFIDESGRVVDRSQNNITTSEGQSYAMLRAVIVDDKETFDRVWKWTSENLKRPDDNLLGWKWGEISKNKNGLLPNGGANSASDAEEDIALALIMAGNRWQDPKYTEDAKKIVTDLWLINTDTAGGKRYLLAGNWAKSPTEIVVNPSYFSPYAWREFAKIDKEHDWQSLIVPAYELLNKASHSPIGGESPIGLPPDWVAIDRESGKLQPPSDTNMKTAYSYDAIRVPFRIALDYYWNGDPRAYNYLVRSFRHLEEQYRTNNKLASSYNHSGSVIEKSESPAMYATSLAYFKIVNPELARKMFEEKIARLYSNDANNFRKDLPYYEQNWLWFGTAFYYGFMDMEKAS